MVVIVGHCGNMGKRYAAILDKLCVPFVGIDPKTRIREAETKRRIRNAGKIIVATPTSTHMSVLKQINQVVSESSYPPRLGWVDVLCEKPVTKKISELAQIRKFHRRIRVAVVNQYAHLPQYYVAVNPPNLDDLTTRYNYFRHGDDGLAWDCFQLFVLSVTTPQLREDSPIWKCRINGVRLRIEDMDLAYERMVADFLGPMRRVWGIDLIEHGTRKVNEWIGGN